MKRIILLILVLLVGCSGKEGAQGPPGQNGSTYNIISEKRCHNFPTTIGVELVYNIIGFSNNEYFVYAAVNGTVTASTTDYFTATNPNSLGSELLYYTLSGDPPTYGAWFFTNVNNIITVRYSNSGSTHDGFTYTFTIGDCSISP